MGWLSQVRGILRLANKKFSPQCHEQDLPRTRFRPPVPGPTSSPEAPRPSPSVGLAWALACSEMWVQRARSRNCPGFRQTDQVEGQAVQGRGSPAPVTKNHSGSRAPGVTPRHSESTGGAQKSAFPVTFCLDCCHAQIHWCEAARGTVGKGFELGEKRRSWSQGSAAPSDPAPPVTRKQFNHVYCQLQT